MEGSLCNMNLISINIRGLGKMVNGNTYMT